MTETNRVFPLEAITALHRGRKIEAIKHVRAAFGIGLKEAKETVEHYVETHPDIKQQMNLVNAERAKSGFGWLFFLLALGVAVYYFLR